MKDTNFKAKTEPMPRIAAALERLAGLAADTSAGPMLRIANAVEKISGDGGSSKQLEFVFTDSNAWDIAHKLSKRPCVKTLDTDNNEIVGTIEYTTANNCVVYFSEPQSGKAYVN